MPAWSFKRQFHKAVANGLAEIAGEPPPFPGLRPKRQTIRKNRVDGRDPAPGTPMRLWIAQRTPGREFLGTTPPISSVAIRIPHRGHVEISGDPAATLTARRVTNLARRDGFPTAEAFFDFIEAEHGYPFEGFVNRW